MTATRGARRGARSTPHGQRRAARAGARRPGRPGRASWGEAAYVGDVSALSRLNERYRALTIVVAIVEGDKAWGRCR